MLKHARLAGTVIAALAAALAASGPVQEGESLESQRLQLDRLVPDPVDRSRLEEPGYVDWHRGHVRDIKRQRVELIRRIYALDPDPDRYAAELSERWLALAALLDEHAEAIRDTEAFLAAHPEHRLARDASYCRALAMARRQFTRMREGLPPDDAAAERVLDALIVHLNRYPDDARAAGPLELLGDTGATAGSDLQIRIYEEGLRRFSDGQQATTWRAKVKLAEAYGQPFELSFRDAVSGELVALAALRGKVVVIDCWATWCVPCVAELPRLRTWYDELRDQGLEIIGCTFDEDRAKLLEFVKQRQVPWPQYFQGPGWPWSSKWGIQEIPVLFVIDRRRRRAA